MPTMFEKIWSRHVVAEGPGGQSLLYIDRHPLHEGATAALARLKRSGRAVRRPAGLLATADHYVPTGPGSEALAEPEIRGMVDGVILAIIARIGAGGGVGHAVEYAGPVMAVFFKEYRVPLYLHDVVHGPRGAM